MVDGKPKEQISVMFVCLGNICRSPMAQAVFADMVKKRGFEEHFGRIESSGTGGYHIGSEPDDRTVAKCREKGVPIDSYAQVVESRHFDDFDYLIGMDAQNVRNLQRIKPKNCKAQIKMFGDYGDGKPIQDPYYGADDGFERSFVQVTKYSEGLLKELGFPA